MTVQRVSQVHQRVVVLEVRRLRPRPPLLALFGRQFRLRHRFAHARRTLIILQGAVPPKTVRLALAVRILFQINRVPLLPLRLQIMP